VATDRSLFRADDDIGATSANGQDAESRAIVREAAEGLVWADA
jgi:hypothetical protein